MLTLISITSIQSATNNTNRKPKLFPALSTCTLVLFFIYTHPMPLRSSTRPNKQLPPSSANSRRPSSLRKPQLSLHHHHSIPLLPFPHSHSLALLFHLLPRTSHPRPATLFLLPAPLLTKQTFLVLSPPLSKPIFSFYQIRWVSFRASVSALSHLQTRPVPESSPRFQCKERQLEADDSSETDDKRQHCT
jgi:hypothetical protein